MSVTLLESSRRNIVKQHSILAKATIRAASEHELIYTKPFALTISLA